MADAAVGNGHVSTIRRRQSVLVGQRSVDIIQANNGPAAGVFHFLHLFFQTPPRLDFTQNWFGCYIDAGKADDAHTLADPMYNRL